MNINYTFLYPKNSYKNRMLFRNKNGKLEELNLYDCKNDTSYYTKLKGIKNVSSDSNDFSHENKSNCSVSKIISLIEETTNHR